jgi:hypothetical protein
MTEFKHTSTGYEVRRKGTGFVGGFPSDDHRAVGIVVERFTHPQPKLPVEDVMSMSNPDREAWHTQRNIVAGMPAQIAVYWQDTKVVERLLETDVEPNYPGGAAYRAWDREFPVFAVETGGYGDVHVLTPDGEQAVYIYGHDLPGYDDAEPDDAFRLLVTTAVAKYLDKTMSNEEPAELANAEQYENAEFEGSVGC